MDLAQRVDEETLRADLKTVDVRTVSSALAGHWMVEGAGDYAERLSARAAERAARRGATFVDAIGGIAAVLPEEKIDPRLLEGSAEGESAHFDVETWPMSEGRFGALGCALCRIAGDGGGDVLDEFRGRDYCAFRMRCGASLFWQIAFLPEVDCLRPPPWIRPMNVRPRRSGPRHSQGA